MINLIVFLATVSLLLSFFIVTAKQSVHAVLSLVIVFLLTATMWFLIHVEYLAIMLILVYVGAVMVLFLFVVMMVEPVTAQTTSISITVFEFLTFLACLLLPFIFLPSLQDIVAPLLPLPSGYSSVRDLGLSMFTDYLYPFILVGVVLLAAIIGSVGLTFRGAQNRKSQDIHAQVQVTKADRLKIIKDE